MTLDFNYFRRQDEKVRSDVDAEDIRRRLHDDPIGFVNWLYSGRAFINKNVARIGNVYGEPGISLAIQLSGAKAGLWKDHATDERGDLIDLYRAYMNYHDKSKDFDLSLRQIAKEYLGDSLEVTPMPAATERINKQREKLGTKPPEVELELGAPVASWNFLDVNGNVIAKVERYEPAGDPKDKTFRPFCFKTVDGVAKWKMGTPEGLRPLYRLPEITAASEVVLVEGEKCAQALADIGIMSTTAMMGAKAPIGKTDWSPLAGKTVIVWPDNDKAGIEYAKTVSERLISMGCRVLGIEPRSDKPEKWDAADCIKEGEDTAAIIAGAKLIKDARPKPGIRATPYVFTDPTTIPMRQWLYGRLLLRKFVSATLSPGGIGKSSLVTAEALAMVSGKDLLGVQPDECLRVWLWNLEDPLEETQRKIQAAAIHYDLGPDDIGDRLMVDSGREQKLVIATTNHNGAEIVRPVVESIVAEIIKHRIDVIIIDPFVSSHEVVENDNGAMDMIIKEWGRVADRGNCAVLLVHHTKKMGNEEVTTDSGRGASSQTDGCRVVRTINRMTKEQATKLGIENHRLYFRTLNDKANLQPPVEKSDWFKLVGVDLGNGPTGPGTGDSVGVVTKWELPEALAGMTAADFDKVAIVIRRGKWRESPQAKNWVGKAVAEALGLDVSQKLVRGRVQRMLGAWYAAKSLVVVDGLDEKRNTRKFVEVVEDE
jgi:5S rRNA maturation endonuclease (ribonuclease M5)